MRSQFLLSGLGIALTACLVGAAAHADETPVLELTLKDHVFSPAELHVPAHQKVKIHVRNLDQTAEEFDSDDLHAEKVITGGSEGVVRLRPLKPGRYAFSGEYHEDTAKGVVIAE